MPYSDCLSVSCIDDVERICDKGEREKKKERENLPTCAGREQTWPLPTPPSSSPTTTTPTRKGDVSMSVHVCVRQTYYSQLTKETKKKRKTCIVAPFALLIHAHTHTHARKTSNIRKRILRVLSVACLSVCFLFSLSLSLSRSMLHIFRRCIENVDDDGDAIFWRKKKNTEKNREREREKTKERHMRERTKLRRT